MGKKGRSPACERLSCTLADYCKIAEVNLLVKRTLEPTDAQYLIINALETLELLGQQTFDLDTGNWYISTPSPVLPIAMILPSGDIARVNLPGNSALERIEAPYLIINALETLALLQLRSFARDTGNFYIRTPSPVLPIAMILPSGDIVPTDWMS